MNERHKVRWISMQWHRYYCSLRNHDLHMRLWQWRDELGITDDLLAGDVFGRLHYALRVMNNPEHGFCLHPAVDAQFRELVKIPAGSPFRTPRDYCLSLWLPTDAVARAKFGDDIVDQNEARFVLMSTPWAIVDCATVTYSRCVNLDVTFAEWLDIERAYDVQMYGVRWAHDYLSTLDADAPKIAKRGRPKMNKHEAPTYPYIYDPDPTTGIGRAMVPTWDDNCLEKIIINVTGATLKQVRQLWPAIKARQASLWDRREVRAGRPKRFATDMADFFFLYKYNNAQLKCNWPEQIADEWQAEGYVAAPESFLRRVRRAKSRQPVSSQPIR